MLYHRMIAVLGRMCISGWIFWRLQGGKYIFFTSKEFSLCCNKLTLGKAYIKKQIKKTTHTKQKKPKTTFFQTTAPLLINFLFHKFHSPPMKKRNCIC